MCYVEMQMEFRMLDGWVAPIVGRAHWTGLWVRSVLLVPLCVDSPREEGCGSVPGGTALCGPNLRGLIPSCHRYPLWNGSLI